MTFRYVLCLVLLFPVGALSQTTAPSLANEGDLLAALVSLKADEQQSASVLLKNHSHLLSPNLWDALMQKAIEASDADDPARELFFYSVARDVAALSNDHKRRAFSSYKIGRHHFAYDRISLAEQNYLESKQNFEQIGSRADSIKVLSEIGTLYIYAEDYRKAREYSLQSIALADATGDAKELAGIWFDRASVLQGVASAHSNLGNISKWEGDHDSAVQYLQNSLRLFEQLNDGTSKIKSSVAEALADIGRVYRLIGDHRQALHYLSRARSVAETLRYKSKLARVLNSIGILYADQGDYPKALDTLDQALRLAEQEKDQRELATIPINFGAINRVQGKYDEALKNFRDSLQRAERIEAPDIVAAAQQGIASVYQATGANAEALEWLDRSWETAQRTGEKNRLAELLWRKAELQLATNDIQQAIESARKASDLAERLRLPVISYLALTTQGRAYIAAKKYDLAFSALAEAINRVEYLRDRVAGSEQEQQAFLESKIDPYHSMVELLISQGRKADALAYVERAKGRVLLDTLRNGRTFSNKNMSTAEQERNRRMGAKLVLLNNQLFTEAQREKANDEKIKNLEEQLERARLEYEMFQTELYSAYPKLKAQRGYIPESTLEQTGSLIPNENLAVLEYLTTDKGTYLFALTKSAAKSPVQLEVYTLPLTSEELDKRVSKFHTQLSTRQISTENSYRELYDLLIKPAEKQLAGKKTLCILPDGALWRLPFQALRREEKYFVEEHAIFYAPSLGVLREMMQGTRTSSSERKAERTLLAFANPKFGGETVQKVSAFERGKKLAPLPEAEGEVRTAANLFGIRRSKVYIGIDALEERAKKESNGYDVLHFATHGLLDDRNPMYSYLVLAQSGSGEEDGLLEAREIMNLNLRARLVILSACETGLGRFSAGEGLIGMTWAFFIAGAPATLASLWSVESTSTSQLMVEFHQQLASSEPKLAGVPAKAAALQKAQLKLLKSERFDHPFYWSGFSLFGDPR